MKQILSILSTLFFLTSGYAQPGINSITFDLATAAGTDKKPTILPISKRTIETVYLENAFPNRNYIITVSAIPRLEPTLSIGGVTASGTGCATLEAKFNEVSAFASLNDDTKKESELKTKLNELNTLAGTAGCVNVGLHDKIKTLNKNCFRAIKLPVAVDIQESYDYTITVAAGNQTFHYKFTGKTKGRWLTNYGFLFTSRAIEPQRYFLQQTGEDSFQVRKRGDASILDLRFAPTIFFSYFLDKNLNKDWNSSLSMGVGFNFQSPVISLGYNVMYNQNIGFSVGLVFYEQQKLDGSYTDGQFLKENLAEDKLYEKGFFRPNLFFALNIRLGENPFKAEKKAAE